MSALAFNERELLRKSAITLRIQRPLSHRCLYWVGTRLIVLGARCAGIGQVNLDDTDNVWWNTEDEVSV